MMNIKLALIISVSAYALQMNPVYASLLSSPPASILDTNTHTSAAGCGKLAAEGLCPEARCSEILLSQAHCRSQTCHNVQSSAPASFSTVILGLDPRIQVKQGFLSHLDASVRHWHDNAEGLFENDYSAGIPSFATLKDRLARDDNSFLTNRTMSKLLPPLFPKGGDKKRLGKHNAHASANLCRSHKTACRWGQAAPACGRHDAKQRVHAPINPQPTCARGGSPPTRFRAQSLGS